MKGAGLKVPILFSRWAAVDLGQVTLSLWAKAFLHVTYRQQAAKWTFKLEPGAGQEAKLSVLTLGRSWHRINEWMNKCLCFAVYLRASPFPLIASASLL